MDSIASNATVVTVGGLFIVASFVNLALSIWSKLRRSPPIDQTLRDYVRRDEFERERAERLKTEARLFDLLREVTERNANWQAGISAQLGRLESAVESLKGILK
jgi:hypothetical protein